MSGEVTTSARLARGMRAVVRGKADARVRATWRVLLAMPLLWILTGGVLVGNLQSAVDVIPSGGARGGGLAQSLLHAGFFVLVLGVWARYLDRRPLSSYGISARRGWGRDFLVGVLAVILGFVFWLGVGWGLGATTVTVAPSVPEGSVLFGLVVPFVALVVHAAVQQVVFFRVILEAAVEGVHSRGLSATHAAAVAIPVAVVPFILMHGELSALRAVDLAVAGTVFALLYLHTGELAFGIGAHFGGLYAGIVLSALVRTTGSLPGVLGTVNRYGFPKMVVAYVVVVAWLAWRQRAVGVHEGIVRYTGE